MSTNSNIAIQTENDQYVSIYCHWDGYPSYNGVMLKRHYNDRKTVEELVKMGNIAMLKETIKKTYITAYKAKSEQACTCTKSELFSHHGWNGQEYIYIYNLNGEWEAYKEQYEPSKETYEYKSQEIPEKGIWED